MLVASGYEAFDIESDPRIDRALLGGADDTRILVASSTLLANAISDIIDGRIAVVGTSTAIASFQLGYIQQIDLATGGASPITGLVAAAYGSAAADDGSGTVYVFTDHGFSADIHHVVGGTVVESFDLVVPDSSNETSHFGTTLFPVGGVTRARKIISSRASSQPRAIV